MTRTVLVLSAGAFLIRSVIGASGTEQSLIELIIFGKVPGTEVYLSLAHTAVLAGLCLVFLARWTKQAVDDFSAYCLEQVRQESPKVYQDSVSSFELHSIDQTAIIVSEEELGVISVRA